MKEGGRESRNEAGTGYACTFRLTLGVGTDSGSSGGQTNIRRV